MSTVNLRKMELNVDRMHCLHAAEHAPDPVDAVVLLVARACEALKYTFSDNIAVFHLLMYGLGYRYMISYYTKNTERNHNIFLKLTAVTDRVEITFWLDNDENMFAFVLNNEDDAKKLESFKQFIGSGCYYHKGVSYLLKKAQAQLDKEKSEQNH